MFLKSALVFAFSLPLLIYVCAQEAEEELPALSKICVVQSDKISENSGVAYSHYYQNAIWMHNDSGSNPTAYLVSTESGETLVEANIVGAKNKDWEDIDSFQYADKNYLLIADVGDNLLRRKTYQLCIFPEPELELADQKQTVKLRAWKDVRFKYEDGSHNCEAVAADMNSSQIILLEKVYPTKNRIPGIYVLQIPAEKTTDELIATRAGDLPIKNITAMDFSADGNKMVIRTYTVGFLYSKSPEQTWPAALQNAEPQRFALPFQRQGEGICFTPDGSAVACSSESPNAPLWRVRLPVDPTDNAGNAGNTDDTDNADNIEGKDDNSITPTTDPNANGVNFETSDQSKVLVAGSDCQYCIAPLCKIETTGEQEPTQFCFTGPNPEIPQSKLDSVGYKGTSPEPANQGAEHTFTPTTFATYPAAVQPGDTVLLSRGTYHDLGTIDINVDDVVMKRAKGAKVTLTGNTKLAVTADNNHLWGINGGDSTNSKFQILGDGNTFENMQLINTTGTIGGINIRGKNNTIRDVLLDGHSTGITTLITTGTKFDLSNCLVENVTIQNQRGKRGAAIAIGGQLLRNLLPNPALPTAWTVRNVLIQDCNSEPEIIEIKSSGNTFDNVVVRNCSNGHLSIRNGNNNVIINSWFQNNHRYAGIRINGSNNVAVWNYFQSGDGYGIQLFGNSGIPAGNQGGHNNVIQCNAFNGWSCFLRAFYQSGTPVGPPSGNVITDNYLLRFRELDYDDDSIPQADVYNANTIADNIGITKGLRGDGTLKSSITINGTTYNRPAFFSAILTEN